MLIDVIIRDTDNQEVSLEGLTGEEVLTLTRLVFDNSECIIFIKQSKIPLSINKQKVDKNHL